MATPASSEASEIRRRGRQRLIGAVALVILLVVFVPMVLDSEPRPSRPQPAIPPRQGAPALPAPAPATPVPAPATASVAPTGAAKPSAAAPAKAEGAAVAPDAKAASPKLAGFAVQVGAFRDEAKLNQARDKLAGASIPHYTERLESAGGPLTRLRAGPFATREAAEGAQATLKRAALDGKVVPLP